MCKGKGLKVSGSKNDLVGRIIETEKKKNSFFSKPESSSSSKKESSTNVVSKLVEKIPVIEIKKNKYGTRIIKWNTEAWGEIPADYGRK